jgi:hypothetical protein
LKKGSINKNMSLTAYVTIYPINLLAQSEEKSL